MSALARLPPETAVAIKRLTESPNGKGWLRLVELLRRAARDPQITASPSARDFLAVVSELAADALSKNAYDALLPLDGLLPLGKLGAKSRAAHARSAAATRKLWAADRVRIKTKYDRRVRDGEKYGAIKALSIEFGVSGKTISNIINANKNRK